MNDDLKSLVTQPMTLVWLLLIGATGFSWWVGTGNAAPEAEKALLVTTSLLVVAFVKVRLVIRYFMEVREAALVLRLLTDLWCLLVCAAILALYAGVF